MKARRLFRRVFKAAAFKKLVDVGQAVVQAARDRGVQGVPAIKVSNSGFSPLSISPAYGDRFSFGFLVRISSLS